MKVCEGYIVSRDKYQWILKRETGVDKEGKMKYDLAYFRNFISLIQYLLDIKVGSANSIKEMEGLLEKWEGILTDIKWEEVPNEREL